MLLVEDHALVTDVLEVVLKRRGYDVVKTSTGEEAKSVLESEDIPLLITDIELPGISGLDLIRQLRSENRNARIIAMSGRGDRVLAEALVFGADATLKKPFTSEALMVLLNRL
ncbi:MAG: response regulator [Opitutales bacterium]